MLDVYIVSPKMPIEQPPRVVGVLGKTCSTEAKESLVAMLIGSKECILERTNLGNVSSSVDSGIVLFQQPSSRTVYMYVDHGWMMNEHFLARAQDTLQHAQTCSAGLEGR